MTTNPPLEIDFHQVVITTQANSRFTAVEVLGMLDEHINRKCPQEEVQSPCPAVVSRFTDGDSICIITTQLDNMQTQIKLEHE